MMSYLVRWNWTRALRPVLMAATRDVAARRDAVLPVLIWMAEALSGRGRCGVAAVFKAFYLAPWFFALRAIVYFAIWSLLALWLRGRPELRTHGTGGFRRADRLCADGFAGRGRLAGIARTGFPFLDLWPAVPRLLHAERAGLRYRRRPAAAPADRLAKSYSALLLSMILVWAYLHAMQYIVIWSGNIPDEVTWYLKRSSHGWQLSWPLALGQFVFRSLRW